jgi:hypothetical protein
MHRRSATLAVIIVTSALLQFPAATMAEPGQSSAPTDHSVPNGLVVVIENKPQADQPLDLRALDNPSISGVALQIRWRDIEPVQGKPDWSKLDQLFAAAEPAKKWVQLLIFPGFFSPPWALEGVKTEMFPIQYGPGKGTVERLPMPWDRVYLNRWFEFLKLLSDKYGKSPAFSVAAAAGPTSVSAEFSLPPSAKDLKTWLTAGYTPRKYIDVWKQVFQFYAINFPGQYISLSLGFGLNINDQGKIDRQEHLRTRRAILDQAISLLGRRFVLQYSNLDGNPGPGRGPHGTGLVISYNGRIITGFQLRTSCVRNSGNMGAEGDPPLALRRSIDKGLKPNKAGRRINYLEIYKPDVVADEMQPVLRYGASLFAQ